jgi:hypothetical protein
MRYWEIRLAAHHMRVLERVNRGSCLSDGRVVDEP